VWGGCDADDVEGRGKGEGGGSHFNDAVVGTDV